MARHLGLCKITRCQITAILCRHSRLKSIKTDHRQPKHRTWSFKSRLCNSKWSCMRHSPSQCSSVRWCSWTNRAYLSRSTHSMSSKSDTFGVSITTKCRTWSQHSHRLINLSQRERSMQRSQTLSMRLEGHLASQQLVRDQETSTNSKKWSTLNWNS